MKSVEEIQPVTAAEFERDIRPQYAPVIIKGVAANWPVVQAGQRDVLEVLYYIERLDNGQPADIMLAPQSEKGRFFYSQDMRGFNFRKEKLSLANLARHLRAIAATPDPIGIYAGAALTAAHLPGFDDENLLPLVDGMAATPRIWLGNATQVATHFDLSDNIAVVATGKRRFILFPPQATGDLYVGPLNVTLAGQPVSMVNPLAPDLERYPRFADAQKLALVADLEPGDAIYVPTLWWHHVQATGPVNVLINYWHNDAAHGGGFLALIHAMLQIRDLPDAQREAWRSWFDHFVFGTDAQRAADHIPAHARGINGPASASRDEVIRNFLASMLSAR